MEIEGVGRVRMAGATVAGEIDRDYAPAARRQLGQKTTPAPVAVTERVEQHHRRTFACFDQMNFGPVEAKTRTLAEVRGHALAKHAVWQRQPDEKEHAWFPPFAPAGAGTYASCQVTVRFHMQTADGGMVKNVELGYPDLGITLRAAAGSLDGKLTIITDGEFGLPDMSFPELDLEINDLGALLMRPRSGSSAAGERRPFDDSFLDTLEGHVNVDLDADFKIPVLGSRKGTHEFRVQIARGALNYKQLESGLSRLEDAFLDFEVKDNRLVLVRAVPFLPIDAKDLVYWELDESAQALARADCVWLRTLLHPVVPKSAGQTEDSADKKKKSPLKEIHARNIDIELAIGPAKIVLPRGGEISLGLEDKPAVSRLTVRGEFAYEPDGEEEGTELTASAAGIMIGLSDLPTGRGPLSLEVRARELAECRVSMAGPTPGRLSARFRDAQITGFLFQPPGSSGV